MQSYLCHIVSFGEDRQEVVLRASLVVDKPRFAVVIDEHDDLDSAKDGQLHGLFEESFFPFAVGHL